MSDKIEIDVEAHDNASQVFRNVSANIGKFSVDTNSNLVRFNNTLRSYNNTMRGFNNTVERGMLSAAKAVLSFTKDSIKAYADLERQHAKTMGAMAADYNYNFNGSTTSDQAKKFTADSEALKQQAYKYGTVGVSGTGSLYSPTQISEAQTALVKAGVKPNDIINTDALANIVKFASGNDIDIGTAVDFAVQLGAQFKKKPAEWGKMLDQVTYAANASIIDVPDIIQSMKYAGNMASGFNQPLSDILAALAVMGNAGLKGSQAGTGIQALFARGLSPTGITTASKPPTSNVKNVYTQFKDKVSDKNGNFLGLENFTDVFDESISGLSDVEKAWFVRKLFGMFQQKAALALGRTGDDGKALFGDMADNIENNADGTDDTMYQLAMASLGGQTAALGNAWTGFKQGFGETLKPVVSNAATQLLAWMNNSGNYSFDMESLRKSIYASGDLIGKKYGEQAQKLVDNLGDFLIDALEIGQADSPILSSTAKGVLDIFSGDFPGAMKEFSKGVSDTNTNIKGLPDDLQKAANGVRNLAIALEALYALNLVTRVSEAITSFIRLFSSAKLTFSGSAKVSAASASVDAETLTMNISSANATISNFVGSCTTMDVTAGIVNVYGGTGGTGDTGTGGSNPTGPTGSLPGNSTSTPVLPGFGGEGQTIVLPGNGGTGKQLQLPGEVAKPEAGLPPISTKNAIPSTGKILDEPIGPSAAADAAGAGAAARSAGGMFGTVARFVGMAGNVGMLMGLTGSQDTSAINKYNSAHSQTNQYVVNPANIGAALQSSLNKNAKYTNNGMLNFAGARTGLGINSAVTGGTKQINTTVTNPTSVNVNNKAPVINVNVKVNVAKDGTTTQQVIKDFSGVDNFVYHNTTRTTGHSVFPFFS